MRRTFLSLCVAGFLTALASAPAAAATLRIDIDDFDVAFDGNVLTDGGGANFADADALKTMDFFLDGVHLGGLTSGIFANMAIGVTEKIPASGGKVQGYDGYLALYTSPLFDEGVGFTFDTIDLIFQPFGAPPRLALGGFASAKFIEQVMLPFGVQFDSGTPVDVLFIVNLANVLTNEHGDITSFTGSGVGTVQQELAAVPEPTSMLLLGSGLIGAVGMRRRQQAKAQKA